MWMPPRLSGGESIELREPERALNVSELMMRHARAHGDRADEASALQLRGMAHYLLGDHIAAAEALRRAAERGQSGMASLAFANVLMHLGDAQSAAGDRDAAVATWRRASRRLDRDDAPPQLLAELDNRLKPAGQPRR